MKFSKIALIIVLTVVISTISVFSVIPSAAKAVDINGDGSIGIDDATEIQKVIAGLIEPADNFYDIADVDEDGSVGINDATYIQKYIAGMIDEGATTEPTSEPITEPTSEPATDVIYPSTLSINKTSITLGISEEVALVATCDVEGYYCTFTSEDSSVAEVTAEGVVSAVGTGTTTIVCSTENGLTATCSVTVKPLATNLTLNRSSLSLGVGEQFDFDSSIDNGTAAYYRYYYSDNPDIASIEKSGGLVTAKTEGTATISCILYNGITATCKITVKAAPESVSLSTKSVTLKVGNTFTISESTNSGSYAYGFEWSSSNPNVATIKKDTANKAVISAMMLGTTDITIKTYNGKTATCKVTVSGSDVKCLDVSTWQGTDVDFNKVKASGIDYVILRAGYGKETYQKDDTFEINYKKAKAAGMKVGAYWFSYAMSPKEAVEEANACLYCIKGKTFDLPVYYDMEYAPAITQIDSTTYTNMATSFCNTIKNAGYKSGVYASASVFGYPLNYDTIRENYSVWNAEWNSNYTVDCDIWQFTSEARVDGINGNVDCSYIFNLNVVG